MYSILTFHGWEFDNVDLVDAEDALPKGLGAGFIGSFAGMDERGEDALGELLFKEVNADADANGVDGDDVEETVLG